MKFFIISKQSLKAIFANKGRSLLTVLGIVIGIGSVIALISLGAGVKSNISHSIASLGSTKLTITPGAGSNGLAARAGGFGQGGSGLSASTLTEYDLKSLSNKKKNPLIKRVSGQISGSTIIKAKRYSILGTSASYFAMEELRISRGRLYQQKDIDAGSMVMVLGSQTADDLYGKTNPVGKIVEVEGTNYQIIGVLKQAQEKILNNPNNISYVPYTAAAITFKSPNFSIISAEAKNEDSVEAAKRDITATLLANHKIRSQKLADFSVTSSADLLSTINNITSVLTSLLAGIAAISLLVGGIGIMNIMLVSVTERTREIGLRKAVGAKTTDILGQFVLEAIMLTLAGGLIGIALGYLFAKAAAPWLGFSPIVTGSSVLLAVGVSSIIGLLFGIYPAAKAARLNPIDALRYE
jgi:putative ABC transport system permease protein